MRISLFSSIPRRFLYSAYSGLAQSIYKSPSPTAPDSPEITFGSSPMGCASVFIPILVTSSPHFAANDAKSLSTGHVNGFGSPQLSPAIMVFGKPPIDVGPSLPLFTDSYMHATSHGSQTVVTGGFFL